MAAEHHEADAIAFLAANHARVQALFRSFAGQNAIQRGEVADACAELKTHAALELEIFYPAARTALGAERGSVIDRAEADHAAVARLIGEVERTTLDDPAYTAALTRLAEHVVRHIEREEREIFAPLRSSPVDLDALGARLRRRRDALQRAEQTPGQIEPSAEAEGAYEPALDEADARHLAR